MYWYLMNMIYYLEKDKTNQKPPTRYLKITTPKRTKRKVKLRCQTRQCQDSVKELFKKINHSGNWLVGLCNY